MPQCSALLNGIARQYQIQNYRTALSIKSVTRGAALYLTRQGRHVVTPDAFLILNHDQEYSLEFQGRGITEPVSPFFQRGVVEHVADSLATPPSRQLDETAERFPVTDFYEHLYPNKGRIAALI